MLSLQFWRQQYPVVPLCPCHFSTLPRIRGKVKKKILIVKSVIYFFTTIDLTIKPHLQLRIQYKASTTIHKTCLQNMLRSDKKSLNVNGSTLPRSPLHVKKMAPLYENAQLVRHHLHPRRTIVCALHLFAQYVLLRLNRRVGGSQD